MNLHVLIALALCAVTTVGQYTATDADANDTLAWQTLAGADAPVFELVGTGPTRTLQFKAAARPDFEAPTDKDLNNVYAVSLAVSDGTATTLAVAVTVLDVDEPPVFTEGPTAPSVNENATRVGTYAALDEDGDTITWSLEGTDKDVFTLVAGSAVNRLAVVTGDPTPSVLENTTAVPGVYTGTDADEADTLAWQALAGADASVFELVGTGAVRTLQFKAAPDFEAPTDKDLNNVYAVLLAVSDGTATTTLTVAVTVSDVDEPPVFTEGPTEPSVNENATRVGTYAKKTRRQQPEPKEVDDETV